MSIILRLKESNNFQRYPIKRHQEEELDSRREPHDPLRLGRHRHRQQDRRQVSVGELLNSQSSLHSITRRRVLGNCRQIIEKLFSVSISYQSYSVLEANNWEAAQLSDVADYHD